MDEAWERAVETALEAQADASPSSPRTLALDGTVKCAHGCMPSPSILERYQTLEHLSIANIGLSSLEKFPRLPNLQRLSLSDNRIAGGVEYLVSAGLESLRDLDLSNNRIQFLEDLTPLARLHLVSLDLYECPVTRIGDYRSKVFGMIKSLKYLDNMDAEENERPETDDDEEEEDGDGDGDEEDGDDEEDTGDGEVDGEDRARRGMNVAGSNGVVDGVVDLDEESDADAEETDVGEAVRENGSHHHLANGFRVVAAGEERVDDDEEGDDEEEEYVEDDDDDDDLGEEIDEEEGGEEEDGEAVLVHEIVESEEEEDGVEEDVDDDDEMNVEEEEDDEVPLVNEIDESEEEEDGVEEDVDEDDDMNVEEEEDDDGDEGGEPLITARMASTTEGEIDGHDLGEEDENGEIGEENGDGIDEDEEDFESEYLVQPVNQQQPLDNLEIGNDEEDDESEEEVDNDEEDEQEINLHPVRPHSPQPSSSSLPKRKIDNISKPASADHEDEEDDDDNNGSGDDSVEDSRPSKKNR